MKKIHKTTPRKRIEIGVPFERAIEKILIPKTNTGNLSNKWDYTDWTRYALAREIARRNGGKIPKDCLDILPEFISDIDL